MGNVYRFFPPFAHFASIQLCRLHARLSQSSFTPTINLLSALLLGLLLRRNKDANNNATKNAPLFTDTIRYHNRGGEENSHTNLLLFWLIPHLHKHETDTIDREAHWLRDANETSEHKANKEIFLHQGPTVA